MDNYVLQVRYGKIVTRMNAQTTQNEIKPPRMIPTIVSGFNMVANHVYLILIPVLLDLFLWFGPRLSIKSLIMPVIDELTNNLLKLGTTDIAATMQSTQKMWNELLSSYNVFITLRTFPVGVPSLIARENLMVNPLGTPISIEIPTGTIAFFVYILLGLLGFFLGALFFNQLSRNTAPTREKFSFKQFLTQYLQSVWMAIFLLIIGMILLLPATLILSLFSLFGQGVSQFLILVVGFLLLWILIPLTLSPHGIFVLQQKAMPSMMLSTRLVKFFLPGTGSFILTCAVISEGLNLLWSVPPADSWLTLVGIAAHAFIVTGLIASTFYYYREGIRWMQDNLQRATTAAEKKPDNGGGFLGRF